MNDHANEVMQTVFFTKFVAENHLVAVRAAMENGNQIVIVESILKQPDGRFLRTSNRFILRAADIAAVLPALGAVGRFWMGNKFSYDTRVEEDIYRQWLRQDFSEEDTESVLRTAYEGGPASRAAWLKLVSDENPIVGETDLTQ